MRSRGGRERLAGLLDGALDSHDDMLRKRVSVAFLGLGGHACYYLLWTFVDPQPYESVLLRLGLGGMFLAFLMPGPWIERLGQAWAAYWHLTILLNLPFFFTYMTLRNDTWIWVAGLQAALLLVYLLTSGALNALLNLLGVALGALCAWPAGVDWQDSHLLQAAPVLVFALLGATVLSRSQRQHSRRKTAALLSYAGYVAHELRTPLATIAARATLSRGGPAQDAADSDRHLVELSQEVQRAFALIDILLTNVDPLRHTTCRAGASGVAGGSEVDRTWISDIVAQALHRYPFRDAAEREQVRVRVVEDCVVQGSALLLQHVVMNLVRNALEHGRRDGPVRLGITAQRRANECLLSLEDDGQGVTRQDQRERGLGLLFCRCVVRSVGGELRLSSPPSGGCTVSLCLPSCK